MFLFSAWLLPTTVDSNPKDLEAWLKTDPLNLNRVPPPAQPALFTPYPTSASLNLPPSFLFSRTLHTPACVEVVCSRIPNPHPAVSHVCGFSRAFPPLQHLLSLSNSFASWNPTHSAKPPESQPSPILKNPKGVLDISWMLFARGS